MTPISESSVLVRSMDVTARLTYSVEGLSPLSEGGILLETLIGRYVLGRDACEPWLLIDGRRSVIEIAAATADERGTTTAEILPTIQQFCAQLIGLGLVDITETNEAAHNTESDIRRPPIERLSRS